MKIIEPSPKLVRAVKLYLTNSFGDLTLKIIPIFPNSVFYVDSSNNVLIEHDKRNEDTYIHYYQIWVKLLSYFPIEHNNILLILKEWLLEHYKLVNLKSIWVKDNLHISWKVVRKSLKYEHNK